MNWNMNKYLNISVNFKLKMKEDTLEIPRLEVMNVVSTGIQKHANSRVEKKPSLFPKFIGTPSVIQ